ncbi:hypothetical protein NBRC116589_39950 [Ruegeria sp. HU-ET01832]
MGTGNVLVARQNGVVKQLMTDGSLFHIKEDKVIIGQRARQILSRSRSDEKEKTPMRQLVIALCLFATPGLAELEQARDMMEAGEFEAAREELLPAARSGNAEAEELIGVMYGLGLGVEQDYERAFDWYLRASMKGHPGAQSGVGWYYELGLGMPAPDLVRAYMWYTLSAIGGDPDAAISLEEVVKKMSPEQIERAHVLVNDYKGWMYPFR